MLKTGELIEDRKGAINMVKEYKCFKTIGKTVRENKLIEGDDRKLYDMSLLDKLPIDADQKDILAKDIIKHHWWLDSSDVYIANIDRNWFTGETKWAYQKVYDKKTCKRLYVIVQLTGITMTQRVHDNWNGTDKIVNEVNESTHYTQSSMDLEI